MTHELITRNLADMTATAPPELLPALDTGGEIVYRLAGVHGGCYELFVHEHIRAIRDLKGKRIAVSAISSLEYYFLASMMAYVELDPRRDIVWVDSKSFDGMRRDFIREKGGRLLRVSPAATRAARKKIGRVIVSTAQDRPWEQYYCCMIVARPDFVRHYPIATKRPCVPSSEPPTSVRRTPSERRSTWSPKGSIHRYEIALDVVKSLSYTVGVPTIRRTRCASMVCGCTKGDDQDRSAEAHCAGCRLAVLERVEEGAESMKVRTAHSASEGCKAMKTTSDKSGNGFNRRRFLGNASALTAASLLRPSAGVRG